MRGIILFFLLPFCFELNAQEVSVPGKVLNNGYGTYVQCEKEDGMLGEWVKVDKIFNPSKRVVKKIQQTLKYLDYNIEVTGVYEDYTGRQIALFNKNNGVKCYYGLRKITLKLLKKQYKEKKRSQQN